MAEEQKKPKTTLIKHPKSTPKEQEGESKGDKKKVVVVKKKVVVVKKHKKTVAKQDDKEEKTENASKESDRPARDTGRDSGNQQEGRSSYNQRPQNREGGGRYNNSQNRNTPDYSQRNRAPRGDRRPYSDRQRGGQDGQVRGSQDGQSRGGYQGRPGGGQGGQNRGGYQGRPGGQGGQGGQNRGGYQGRQGGGQGGQGGQGRGGYQGRPGGGQGGQGGPRRYNKPPMKRGGSGPAPSSPPQGEMQKSSPKKFFKAKKSKANYQKKQEEREEKAYRFNKKKTVQRANPVPKEIDIMEVITVSELARKMNLKASDLIAKLMGMGMMVTINQQIDADTASILADEYNCKVNIVSLYDETIIEMEEDKAEDLESRPPIVTVMGHVDHGKTKLLDAIRTENVAGSEHGGITQHIGAYTVDVARGGKITFLDTPGHEAFTLMRSRGAQITDIVILVVAANDGVMPQTIEAINHAKEAKVPIIVAINKIDLPEANPDKVKQQLSDYDLMPEEWGGSTLFCEISALKRQGIDDLLDVVMLQSEVLELKANYKCRAEGKIIESKVDHGRGIVSTVLIQRGILKVGDSFVAGIFPGKVRAMFNDRGEKVKEANPSMPVEILGFTGIANSGEPFQVTENERFARQIGNKRQELKKVEEASSLKKITLDNLYDSIQDGEIQELKVIVKGDVHGSVEALQSALEKLSTREIRLVVIHATAGAINERDVMLAAASNALILGFHVRPTPKAMQSAEREKVEIRKYNIIYDAVEDIKSAMEGLLSPELKEETIGEVEVRETFKVPKIGVIAGCYVTSGTIKRNAQIHVYRDDIEIYTGKINSLKRFKDDAKEVEKGYECGIGIENFNDIKVGDRFEVFEIREIAKKLGESLSSE